MSKNNAFVRFDKVDKSYDGKLLVVKDLNLDIAEGEFITMLGPSGSGKTTCLMMLAGFETPTNGEIYLDSNPISNIPPHKRGIGMVFQNYALFPHMTVNENLAFPLEVRKLNKSDIDEKVKKALDMVELGAFGNRMPLLFSGGQQQRGKRSLGGRACVASDPIPFPSTAFSSPECQPGALGKPEDEESGNFRKNAWADRSWANREDGGKIRGFAGDERSIL